MIRLSALILLSVSTTLFAQTDLYRIRFSEEQAEGAALRTFKGEAHFPHPAVFAKQVLTDYPRFKEFFPLMTESEAQPKGKRVRFKFRSRWPIPAFWVVVEFQEREDPNGHFISFKKLEGNVRELAGSVRIAEEGEKKNTSGLFVEFRFDPGKMYPQWLVAKAAKPYLEEAMMSLGKHAALCHREEVRKNRVPLPATPPPTVK